MNFTTCLAKGILEYKGGDYSNPRLVFPLILFFSFVIMWSIIVYKTGVGKKWRVYYPTILFFICGDLIYNVIFHDRYLWVFKSPFFSHKFFDFITAGIIFTCTTLIYLHYYPRELKKKVGYVLLWTAVYSGIECAFYSLGVIVYYNGWNCVWSVIHNLYQFILLRVHHINPLRAWIFSLIILYFIMRIFGVTL